MIIRIALLIMLLAFSAPTIWAAEKLDVTTSQTKDYIRLNFATLERDLVQSSINDRKVTIKFKRAVDVDLSSIIAALSQSIESATFSENGKMLTIFLKEKSILRKFVSDSTIGIDLIKIEPGKAADAAKKVDEKIKKDSIKYSEQGEIKQLSFPLQQKTAAAAFVRHDRLFIVFDKALNLALPENKAIEIEKVSAKNKNASIFKINMASPNIAIKNDGVSWEMLFGAAANQSKELPVKIKNEPNPAILIEALKAAKPVEFTDPDIGDRIIAIPLYEELASIKNKKTFPEVTLLPTLQGVALEQLADRALYKVGNDGIEIGGKLNISAAVPPKPKEKQMATILPFKKIFSEAKETYTDTRKRLFANVINAASEERKNKRLELAEFFFNNEIYDVSYGIIKDIEVYDPQFASAVNVQMMKGISLYMLRKYKEALQVFITIYQENQNADYVDEVKLWVWVASYKLEERKKQSFWEKKKDQMQPNLPAIDKDEEMAKTVVFDFITNENSFIKDYPSFLRNDFKLMAVEGNIANSQNKAAEKILDSAIKDGAEEYFFNTITFLKGQLAEKDASYEEAKLIYEKLMENTVDRLNRGRAALALTKMELSQGAITNQQAIKNLENVLIIWRGDRLELEILSTLGELYWQEKDYIAAFKTWRQLVTSFSNTEQAVETAAKMRENFVKLFDGGAAYDMQPVSALALYFEFRELTPIGAQGDRIIRQLADYFVRADLLESAAVLLTHQVRYRSQGEDRVDVAEKLARVHLFNKKPNLALEILELTEAEKKTEVQEMNRKYLKAEIYKDTGDYAKALSIMQNDDSYIALKMRSDIYWQNKNWESLVDTLEERFEARKQNPQPLSNREVEDLIRLAVAYAILGERFKLSELRKNFAELIIDEESQKKFDYVSKERGNVSYKNFSETTKIDEIENFLSTIEKPAAPPEPTGDALKKEQEAKILEGEEPLTDLPEAPL